MLAIFEQSWDWMSDVPVCVLFGVLLGEQSTDPGANGLQM